MVEVVLTSFSISSENFSNILPIPSNIVAPPSVIVEISADCWTAGFFLWKTMKTAFKLLYKRRHYTLLNVWTSFLDIQRDKHTNKKQHCFSSPVAVRPPVSTEFCVCIEDLRSILHPLTFSDLTHSFCARPAPEKFGENCPIAVFCL